MWCYEFLLSFSAWLLKQFLPLCSFVQKKFESSLKEKEDFSKEKQALSKQIEELKQGTFLNVKGCVVVFSCYHVLHNNLQWQLIGKRSIGNVSGEQVMKEKEEKEHRIQVNNSCSPLFFIFLFPNWLLIPWSPRFWRKLWRGREKSWERKRRIIGWKKRSVWQERKLLWIKLKMSNRLDCPWHELKYMTMKIDWIIYKHDMHIRVCLKYMLCSHHILF